jgi:hypothetical protein
VCLGWSVFFSRRLDDASKKDLMLNFVRIFLFIFDSTNDSIIDKDVGK